MYIEKTLISKKDWIELLFKKWSQKIAAAAILLGPKKLRVLMMSQCEITRHGLSDASLRMFELLGGMHSTCFWFMVYIPPINNKLGPTNMAPMASKTWVLKQQGARSSLLLRSVHAAHIWFNPDPILLTELTLHSVKINVKARLHRRFLSRQLDAIFVAPKLQLQNRRCKPSAIFNAICRRDIVGVSNMIETCWSQ